MKTIAEDQAPTARDDMRPEHIPTQAGTASKVWDSHTHGTSGIPVCPGPRFCPEGSPCTPGPGREDDRGTLRRPGVNGAE